MNKFNIVGVTLPTVDKEFMICRPAQLRNDDKKQQAVELQKRLESFKNRNWRSKINPLLIAAAGFSFYGDSDRVECRRCSKIIDKLPDNTDFLETHYRISPDCSFLKTIGFSKDLQIPKYSKFAKFKTRLETMKNVPKQYLNDLPSFETLALTGFYYHGTLDRMCCFHCGLILRDWDSETIPKEVHNQFGKNCLFIYNFLEKEKSGKNLKLKYKPDNSGSVGGSQKTQKNTNSSQSKHKSDTTTRRHSPVLTPCQRTILDEEARSRDGSAFSQLPTQFTGSRQSRKPFIPRPIGRFARNRAVEVDGPDRIDGQSRPECATSSSSRPTDLETTSQQTVDDNTSRSTFNPVLSPVEQAVLEVGYSSEVINQAILERRAQGEGNFPDATSLCLAVMEIEENDKK